MVFQNMQNSSDKPAGLHDKPSLRTVFGVLRSYRMRSGMGAWVLHRLTGLMLVLYLPLHVAGLRSLQDPAAFEQYVTLYRSPLFKIAEAVLVGVVAFHALNGLRIMLQDFFFRSDRHKMLFGVVMVLTVLVTLVAGYQILSPYVAAFLFQ
ncbi:succinate dehydrogenase, cytochrome b556 subunit [Prosthecochloris ethylica]|nr:succinate dehydrogenase, cytochrome b556 subunit [Prosthecochloris ethylica]